MTRIPHTCDHLRHRQQGLTLVELMVALTISLILTAGVIQIFLSSKQSHNVQNGMARLQENARFALDALSKDIGNAGYAITVVIPNGRITLANTKDGVGTASDQIEVNYQSATDCLGQASGGIATDRYYINGTNLMCLGNGSTTAGIIALGVENMQILYGIDTNGDGIANQYIKASATMDITKIVSVRVAVLVSTVDQVGMNAANNNYTLLDAPLLSPLNNNLLRRVFTRTILVRTTLP